MSLADYIDVDCPKCKTTLSIRSVAGRCTGRSYWHEGVPLDIAKGIDGDWQNCTECECEFMLKLKRNPMAIMETVVINND